MRRVSRSRALVLVVAGPLAVAAACWAASRGVEPVATWLYPFAWYPLLLAVEGGIALRRGSFLLLGRSRLLLSVLGWSVPIWMLWELLNFRLENWYYVFVPDRRVALWTGVVVSFATVLPACFLPAALLWPGGSRGGNASGPGSGRAIGASRGLSPTGADRGRALSDSALVGIRLAGLGMLVLSLVWPRFFFPLVWGAFVLLAEPGVYREARSRSLLADAVAGRWERIGALLAGGAAAGLAWEALNVVARGSWIYTVPFLERLKLFEMPLLGFLGFPPLALSCFALYQWLGVRGWSVPLRLEPAGTMQEGEAAGANAPGDPAGEGTGRSGDRRPGTTGRWAPWAWSAAGVLVVLTLLGMEAWTISSRTPRLRDLPGLLPSDVEALRAWGIDSPFALARASPEELAPRIPGAEPAEVRSWTEAAGLATTRGIGARNARILERWGVGSLEVLARTDPAALAACFRSWSGADVRPAQVRVWWRAARRRAGADAGDGARRVACE